MGTWSGVDCGGTLVLLCRIQSVQSVLAHAAQTNWEVLQPGVQTTFRSADLKAEGFVKMTPWLREHD